MTYEECKDFLKEKDLKTDLNIEKMLVAHYVMKNVRYDEKDFERICGFIHICYSMSNVSIKGLVACFIYEQARMDDDEILDMPYTNFIAEAIQFEVTIDFKDFKKKLNKMYNEIFEERDRYIDVIDNNDQRGNLKLLAECVLEQMEKVNEAIDNVVYELDDLCNNVEQFDIEKERIESKYE